MPRTKDLEDWDGESESEWESDPESGGEPHAETEEEKRERWMYDRALRRPSQWDDENFEEYFGESRQGFQKRKEAEARELAELRRRVKQEAEEDDVVDQEGEDEKEEDEADGWDE